MAVYSVKTSSCHSNASTPASYHQWYVWGDNVKDVMDRVQPHLERYSQLNKGAGWSFPQVISVNLVTEDDVISFV